MPDRYAELTFTDSVKRVQTRYGTREQSALREGRDASNDRLGPREAEFIAARDSLYMATVTDAGWPYVQHRGGRPGFLKVLGPTTVGFADFRGNRQYLSLGNLDHDDRVSLILVDYPNRRRLKLLGHARVLELAAAPPALIARIESDDYPAVVERVTLVEIAAYDWNCPQHITPRYSATEVEAAMQPLRARIAALEALLRRSGVPIPDPHGVAPSPAKENTP